MTDYDLVRVNVTSLKERIKEYNKKISNWQSKCSHENTFGVYKGVTGNWCKNDDSYWIDAKCYSCDKKFFVESLSQNKFVTDEYHRLACSGKIYYTESELMVGLRARNLI